MAVRFSPETRHRYTIRGLARIFERLDTILAERPVTVVTVNKPSTESPAYSIEDRIALNESRITDSDLSTIIRVQGLNYHELAHVLFTPMMGRRGPSLESAVGREPEAFNALEDQRIESILTHRFPSVVPHLTAATLRWILDAGHPEAMSNAFPLLWGRRFLPDEVREAARDAYCDPENVDELIKIIDTYRILDLTKHSAAAAKLVLRFGELVNYHAQPHRMCIGSGSARPLPNPLSQEEEQEQAGGQGDAPEDNSPDGDAPEDNSPEGDAPEDNSPDGDAPEDNSPGDNSPEDSSREGRPSGDSNSTELRKLIEETELRKLIEEKEAEIYSDPAILKDASEKRQQAREGVKTYEEDLKPLKLNFADGYSPSIRSVTRRFEEELRALNYNAQGGWDRRTSSGRLNLDRYIVGCEPEEAFDVWDEGTDGFDLEVVSLIDDSGSMSRRDIPQITQETAWIIDRAVKHVDGTHRAFAFGHVTGLLYPHDQKPRRHPYQMNFDAKATLPGVALKKAEDIFSSSKRANKLLLIVTDGIWDDRDVSDQVIDRVNARGVTTALAFIRSGGYMDFNDHRHGCQIFKEISNISQLPLWGRDVVLEAVKRRGGR